MKRVLLLIITGLLLVSACKKKGCIDEEAINFDEKAKKDDGSCEYDQSLEIPDTYSFLDENGNSTVSFDGQKQRLDMLSEMVTYLKTGNTKGTILDADQLKNMYANENYNWIDANGLGTTGSSKQLKNKTAGGDASITDQFEFYFDSVAAISAYNRDGSPGTSGVYPEDGKGPYLMNANGQEYTQLIEKGLMGAVFYYNIVLVYLSDDKMNVDNTTAVDAENGKYYTEMEHHWDEAFGYFSSEIDYPTNGADRFIGEYAHDREDLLSSSTKIMNAFLTGRAAISSDDMTTRDQQRGIIKTELEKVFAATGIHYLNSAIENISSTNARNHALSEAYAFIESLQYGGTDYINSTDVNSWLNTIGKDFNNVTIANLNIVKDEISSALSLDDIKDQL